MNSLGPPLPHPPAPWKVPPHRIGLELWLLRRPVEQATLRSLEPVWVFTDEANTEGHITSTEEWLHQLTSEAHGGSPWIGALEASSVERLVQELLGLPAAGAAALILEHGHGHLFRADRAGWTLLRSNLPDPARRAAADLGDGIAE